MASIEYGSSSVLLALVLTHSSCAAAAATCLHLVSGRVEISTGGALVVDIDGGGAANFNFSHSSSAARAAVVIGCRRRGADGTSMCDLAHGGDVRAWEASTAAGSRGCAAHRQSLLRRLWRHRHHIGCVRAARSPSTATRPAHLLAAVACARRSAGHVSRGRRSRVRCASVARSSKAVGRRIQ